VDGWEGETWSVSVRQRSKNGRGFESRRPLQMRLTPLGGPLRSAQDADSRLSFGKGCHALSGPPPQRGAQGRTILGSDAADVAPGLAHTVPDAD
jgi:hypothetical protein